MKITVLAGGTRGDVQPLAAVAQKLDELGHSVRFVAHHSFSFLIEGTTIEFVPAKANDPRETHPASIRARPRNPLGTIRHIRRLGHDYGDKAYLRDVCETSDFILFSYMCWPAAHIAECLDVPCAAAYLSPHFRTREFPRPVGPVFFHRHRFGPLWNLFTHRLMERLAQSRDKAWLNRWRQEDLGLPTLTGAPQEWAEQRHVPRLYGFSPFLLPKPRDWAGWHHVTGYWFWKPPVSWKPPQDLDDFLSSGSPPIFISFSSSAVDKSCWSEIVIPAVRESGCRAVIASGWSSIEIRRTDDIFVVESCPLDWLLSRVSVVVHSCGASTIAEVVRSGKPSICIPMFGEQRFFAARLERLGLAHRPLTLKNLGPAELAEAIKVAINDDKLLRQADRLRDLVLAEDGTCRAADLIEQIASGKSRQSQPKTGGESPCISATQKRGIA